MGCCCLCCDTPKMQFINRWVLFGLTILTWIFSIVSVASCTFISIGFDFSDRNANVGLFGVESSDGQCQEYVESEGTLAGSQFFGVMVSLSLGLAIVGISLVIFFLKDKAARIVWNITRSLYGFAIFCVLGTFLLFADVCGNDLSESATCGLGAAGYITSINFWFLVGVISTSFKVPVPDKPLIGCGCCHGGVQHQVNTSSNPGKPEAAVVPATTTRTIENTPEGRKITEEVVDSNGNKTVTVTIETV